MHGLIFETSVWLLAESTRLLTMSLPANQLNEAAAKSLPVCESVGQSPLVQFKSSLFATFVLCRNYQWRLFHARHFPLPVRPCSSHSHPKNKQLDAGRQAANSFGQAVARSLVLHPCGKFAITRDSITRQVDFNLLLRIAKEQTNILCRGYSIHPLSQALPLNLKPWVNKSLLWLLHRHKLSTALPIPRSASTGSFKLDSQGTAVLCLLNTPDLVSSLTA